MVSLVSRRWVYIDKHQDGSINDGNELLYHDIAGTFCNAGMKAISSSMLAFFPGNSFSMRAAQAVQLFYVCGTGFKGGHFCNSGSSINPYISTKSRASAILSSAFLSPSGSGLREWLKLHRFPNLFSLPEYHGEQAASPPPPDSASPYAEFPAQFKFIGKARTDRQRGV